jgi:hypothetical protein
MKHLQVLAVLKVNKRSQYHQEYFSLLFKPMGLKVGSTEMLSLAVEVQRSPQM